MDEYSSQKKRNERRGRKEAFYNMVYHVECLKKHKRKIVKSTGDCSTFVEVLERVKT